ncbi:oxidoreductase [Pollutimonas nitritireducens]|uniref:Oxidoreductase n=1 Tax=Pollutimonas nitritireducens TaxID=2045209 RepID=A0A2N4UJ18_9BURK|nr:glucose 1-dehydrogenase [Pollutimonas nitritireducens]PLC55000.1 oxidoreductase [Pollutimonas nitritireducens]
MNDLKNKVVVVTGASTGIGAAVAQEFGRHGASVVVHYFSSSHAAKAVADGIDATGQRAITVQGDLHHTAECEGLIAAAVAKFGRIDVLINNAGALVKRVPIVQMSDDVFDDVVNLNVRSVLMCTRYAVPHMPKGSSIINLTSVAARNGGGPGSSLYAGSKGFVSTITKGLAKELIPNQIRVNAVAPGVITTPFHEKFTTAEQLEGMRSSIPMGRFGTAQECVGAFLYLASNEMSAYVTGQIIEVNGGQYMP